MIETLTYNEILNQMKTKFKQESGFEADDASDIGIRLRLLAGQLFSQSANINFVAKQLFLQTATGKYLDMHAQMRGLLRRDATKAHGTVRFFTEEEEAQADIIIPKGTMCTVSGENAESYVTTQEATLLQGQIQVDVTIIAANSGKKGNAAIGVISMLVNPPQGITSVTNITELTGGSEQESDEVLRQRILESYQQMSNGVNSQYYKELAMQHPKVTSVNVINAARGAGTVDVVFDTTEEDYEQIMSIQNELDKIFDITREMGTDVKAIPCRKRPIKIMVHIKSNAKYDSNMVVEQCKKAIIEYIDSLEVGEYIMMAKYSNVIYNVDGVENYSLISPLRDTFLSGRDKFFVYRVTVLDIL